MSAPRTDIFTPEQAADYLQVNRETIYRYIRDGKLVASRLGRGYRITKRNLDLLLATNQTRSDVPLRMYSDRELADLLEADQLDSDAQAIINRFREQAKITLTHER